MIAIDISNEKQFEAKLVELENDLDCLGGAIAVPYKKLAAELTKSNLAAVNCIYRNSEGRFTSQNTDGLAGARLIQSNFDFTSDLFVIGWGVTSRAIYESLPSEIKSKVKIFTRKDQSTCANLRINDIFTECDKSGSFTIFNATTVGGPIDPQGILFTVEEMKKIKALGIKKWIDVNNVQIPSSKIQDINELLGIHFVNGNFMNEKQAEISFELVNNGIKII